MRYSKTVDHLTSVFTVANFKVVIIYMNRAVKLTIYHSSLEALQSLGYS